jgi:hypothetical protein
MVGTDFAFATDNPFRGAMVFILALIVIAAWVILAASRFIQGGIVERPERAEFRTRNEIVESLISLVLAAGLFGFHWRWLRRRGVDLDTVRAVPRPPLPS